MPPLKDRSTGRSGLVYSTEAGRMCPVCRRAVASCTCAKVRRAAPSGDGIVRVARETKGRGGKAVTLVKGLDLEPADLLKLAHQLKTACGSGGTVKDGVIELQGEHRDRVIAFLAAEGYHVKAAGG